MVFLFSVMSVFAQNKTVNGKVTSSSDGLPLPGVSVTVKGVSGVGTQTDANGNFKFTHNVPRLVVNDNVYVVYGRHSVAQQLVTVA